MKMGMVGELQTHQINMSFTWKLSILNDLNILSSGIFQVVSKVEEVTQRILVTLGHNWQEYFMNVPAGVPWYEIILGSKDTNQAENILRSIILEVPGVVSISSFAAQLEGREFSIQVSVEVFVANITYVVDITETFFIG